MVLRAFKPVLTLKNNDAAHTSLPSPESLLIDGSVWAAFPLVVVVRYVFRVCVCMCVFSVLLPSEIPKLPSITLVRGLPMLWKLLLLHDSLCRMALSLNLLSLFSSFLFCSTSIQRDWAAFLGAWCPLSAFRNCFVDVVQHSNDLFWIWSQERKWPPHPIPLPSWDHQ